MNGNIDMESLSWFEQYAERKRRKKLMELYDVYIRCRDQQWSRFWENSKYVWTFLAICFAGYGVLLTSNNEIITSSFLILSTFVCCVGFVLSYFWLKMTQGSKHWYEVYETVIWKIESLDNELNYDKNLLIHNYWGSKEGEQGYSPSRIMISIGYVLMLFWISAYLFCLFIIMKDNSSLYPIYPISFGLIIFSLCFGLTELMQRSVSSTSIRGLEEERIFNYIKGDLDFLFPNKYIYVEVNNKEVKFILNDTNADLSTPICSFFIHPGLTPTINGYEIKYPFWKIKEYYDKIETDFITAKDRIQRNGKYKNAIILHIGKNLILYSSDSDTINDDLNYDGKIISDNKIVIPLESIIKTDEGGKEPDYSRGDINYDDST